MKILLLCLCFTLYACKKPSDEAILLNTLSNDIVLTAYDKLYDSAVLLQEHAEACSAHTVSPQVQIEKLKPYWIDAMKHWQGVSWVQFGPIKHNFFEWKIQFWPDKKNLVGRKVKALLSLDDLNYQSFDDAGVVAQGLSALEYVLFDKNTDKFDANKRCRLVRFITESVVYTSSALKKDWTNYHHENIVSIQVPLLNADIISDRQGLAIFMGGIVETLDVVIDKKLSTPFAINKDSAKANAYFLESWRSQTSRDHVISNIDVLLSIVREGGLTTYLHAKNKKQLAEDIEQEIQLILYKLKSDKESPSYFQSLNGDKQNASFYVKPIYEHLEILRGLIKKDLMQAMNIQLGFNANDGDS